MNDWKQIARLFAPATLAENQALPVSFAGYYCFVSDGARLLRIPRNYLTGAGVVRMQEFAKYEGIISACYRAHEEEHITRLKAETLNTFARHLPLSHKGDLSAAMRVGCNLIAPSDILVLNHVVQAEGAETITLTGHTLPGKPTLFQINLIQVVLQPIAGLDAITVATATGNELPLDRQPITV